LNLRVWTLVDEGLGSRNWLPLILLTGKGVVVMKSVRHTLEPKLALELMSMKFVKVTEILRAVRMSASVLL
jgi:hypothetical protein